ncbi:MAG: sigma-70 family RNA polymerase sigma factor [Verrucomicrobiae bacterium]|nr:sigma-70 family RNA polymerase sigma factor [Verrucomicrobiae bacterium]
MSEVTAILAAMARGEGAAADELLPLVYEELRRLAAARMAREGPGQTLQPTALVHEAWLRLVGSDEQREWEGRGHFFGAAAEAMRRILVERARRRRALKRGGGAARMDLDELELAGPEDDDQVLEVHAALDGLARADAQAAELVKLRFFAGLGAQEAAASLGIPERSATRLWAYARAWLHREIERARREGAG